MHQINMADFDYYCHFIKEFNQMPPIIHVLTGSFSFWLLDTWIHRQLNILLAIIIHFQIQSC